MSNAPPDKLENATARDSRPNMPGLTRTGPRAAPALTSDSSESALCGLIVASMRRISAITAAMAASAPARSAAWSSTLTSVPMIASSARYQPPADPWAGVGDGETLAAAGEWTVVMVLDPGPGRLEGP